jgi:hypothetical protein
MVAQSYESATLPPYAVFARKFFTQTISLHGAYRRPRQSKIPTRNPKKEIESRKIRRIEPTSKT